MAIVAGIVYGGWIARRIYIPVPEIADTRDAQPRRQFARRRSRW